MSLRKKQTPAYNCSVLFMKKKAQLLSLIIPSYKQEKTIVKDIQRIKKSVEVLKISYEIIIVVDGFLDKTFVRAKRLRSKKIKVIGYLHNHGKGYAVRFGMAKAKGNLIAFLDAGMDLHPKAIKEMLTCLEEHEAHIVIGSKLHPNSKVYYPWQRKILSWGYRSMVHALFGLSIRDTQVGLKLFRREVLEDVLPRLLVKQFAFDIEMLAVAHAIGYKKIVEFPIALQFRNWSSITSKNFMKTSFLMLWDTAAVYYRLRIRKYYSKKSKRQWRYDPELNFRINTG